MLRHFKIPQIPSLTALRGGLTRKDVVPQQAAETVPSEFAALRPLRPLADDAPYDLYGGVLRKRRWTDLDGPLGRAVLLVLPIIVGVLYFGLIAADRYVSHTEFVVRNAEQSGAGRLASMITTQAAAVSTGGSGGGDSDANVVVSFMKSHDGMSVVDQGLGLRQLFSRDEADFAMAYPGLFRSDSAYRLKRYFDSMVSVEYDPATSVIKLTTEAFRPEDAKAVGEALLSGAEALVNRIDTRARQDAIKAAAEQVAAAHKEVIEAQAKLTAFRLREKMIDPVAMSGVIIETIAGLAAKSVELKAQLSDMTKNAPANNQAVVIRSQIASLEEQIAAQQRKLAGPNSSMTPILAEYQQLSLQREFADRIYAASLEQAEAARVQAGRQHVFIERISGPTLADYAIEPRRLLMIALIVIVAFSVFGILKHIVRDSRAHHGR